jgi:protein-arginine kinase activator protein McsA
MAPKKQFNLRISEAEMDILKQYCQQEDREQSEVIREFIRSLKKKIRANTGG